MIFASSMADSTLTNVRYVFFERPRVHHYAVDIDQSKEPQVERERRIHEHLGRLTGRYEARRAAVGVGTFLVESGMRQLSRHRPGGPTVVQIRRGRRARMRLELRITRLAFLAAAVSGIRLGSQRPEPRFSTAVGDHHRRAPKGATRLLDSPLLKPSVYLSVYHLIFSQGTLST